MLDVFFEEQGVTLADLGAFKKWPKKAKEFGFKISEHIERITAEDDRGKGLDIADYLWG